MQGLFIDAEGAAQTVVKILTLPGDNVVTSPRSRRSRSMPRVSEFLAMLTDYGLTAQEAAGLVDVWKRQFFETPGKRLLVILPARDYDAMCPLRYPARTDGIGPPGHRADGIVRGCSYPSRDGSE